MPKPKRVTATPKRPTKNRRTAQDTALEAIMLLAPAYLRDRVHAAFDAFITAVLAAAIGVRHLYAKDAATPVLGPE